MFVDWLVGSLVCLLVRSFVSSHPATGCNGRRAPGGGGALRALFQFLSPFCVSALRHPADRAGATRRLGATLSPIDRLTDSVLRHLSPATRLTLN